MFRPLSSLVPLRWVVALAFTLWIAEPAAAQTKLLRFPDVRGDSVVFTYAGDLWLAPISGGTARRLTAHPGVELFAKFSPDGKWIAFTGQYDGDEQVYVVPSIGGVPRQLTFYPALGPLPPRWGYDHQVYGWAPDGKGVLFRAFSDTWDISDSRLYTVPVEGGLPTVLPMPRAGAGALSPDGKSIVYSPLARDFRTWKRYEGGWAQDLWHFDFATQKTTNLTHHDRTDRDPMWIGDRFYFVSDRDGTLNLYSQELSATAEARQLTRSTSWDVRWASADEANGKIVYELGGELAVYDTKAGAERKLSILVPDDGLYTRPSQVSAADAIEGAELSPKAERVAFIARGDLFTAPIEKGPTRNLTNSSTSHERAAAWSPDGSQIAFISDRDGEEELYLIDQAGGAPRQLTDGHAARLYQPAWSPDGKSIAFADKDGRIFILTVADKKILEVADDPRGFAFDYVWSPDSRFLAFSLGNAASGRSISIWSREDGKVRPATNEIGSTYSPVFEPEGKYLFFLGDAASAPQISFAEWNFATNRATGVFALALAKDTPHPFPAESDEVTVEKNDANKEEADAEGGKKAGEKAKPGKAEAKVEAKDEDKAQPVKIDFDGLASRITRVPVPIDNYFGLGANKGNLLLAKGGPFFYGRPSYEETSLHVFSREDRELKLFADGINGSTMSADGLKVLIAQGGGWNLYDAAPGGESSKKSVSTDGLRVDRNPKEEWRQTFDEVWRRFRDWFYVANMHGYDWKAIGDRYRGLLEHVAHRSDLNYVMGEMIAELNVSHAYVSGGDYDLPPRPSVALPGARFELDRAAGRYKIAKIFAGHNGEDRYRSPLTEVGVDAKVGDYVLAIDGIDLPASENPYRLLRNKADRPVELTLNSKPLLEGSRKVSFRPLSSETPLVYLDWVETNRRRVSEATQGRVGYFHIPDMGEDGIREFIKWYYPQIRKEGLVVDVRGNGGGNVSPMLIERLSRRLLGADFGRNDDMVQTYPAQAFWGSMVCLISETSASDGDIFPYMFRQAGLGPLIGKRSWGGVVGISGRGPLIDGGDVFVPESASASITGQWIIEGYGVAPDIEVENDPALMIAGGDPQLERGITEVLKAMAANPKKLPSRPADPVRTQERYDGVPKQPVP